MTFSTLASPGVSLQGGGGSGGGGGGTPGGSDTQIQYNSSGTFAGASGLTTNGTELTIASGTKTADAPVLNMSQTWNNGATTFTGLKFNAAGSSDANSAAGSLLMDLQVGGASRFSVSKAGLGSFKGQVASGFGYSFGNPQFYDSSISSGAGFGIVNASQTNIYGNSTAIISFEDGSNGVRIAGTRQLGWVNGHATANVADTILTRRGAANLRLGAADAAAPVAQTLSVQSVVAGTTNTAGANLTITGSQGTGTGAGGSIIFQVAPAGGVSNGVQNALVDALMINSARQSIFAAGSRAAPAIVFSGATTMGFWNDSNSQVRLSSAGADWIGITASTINLPTATSINWAGDVYIQRDAANTLALRNGANAQTFRVYNTTDGTNFERFSLSWVSNAMELTMEKGGTGSNRDARFVLTGALAISTGSSSNDIAYIGTNSVGLASGVGIRWTSGTNAGSGHDVAIGRSAAGVLAVRDGVSPLSSAGGAAIELKEQTAPSAPATNNVRIYAEDNGSGKTRLMALFATGAAVQIAIEP